MSRFGQVMHADVDGWAPCGADKRAETFRTKDWERVECRRCLKHKPTETTPEPCNREVHGNE